MSKKIGSSLVLAIVAVGCGTLRHRTYTAPDKRAVVRIDDSVSFGGGFRIVLEQESGAVELFRATGDNTFYFTDVYWSPDGQVVGVATCGEPVLRLAVNRSTLDAVPFSVVAAAFQERWRIVYGLPDNAHICVHSSTDQILDQ